MSRGNYEVSREWLKHDYKVFGMIQLKCGGLGIL